MLYMMGKCANQIHQQAKTFPQKGGEKSTQVASVQGININWFALPK